VPPAELNITLDLVRDFTDLAAGRGYAILADTRDTLPHLAATSMSWIAWITGSGRSN
jgi:hypothetical protein